MVHFYSVLVCLGLSTIQKLYNLIIQQGSQFEALFYWIENESLNVMDGRFGILLGVFCVMYL